MYDTCNLAFAGTSNILTYNFDITLLFLSYSELDNILGKKHNIQPLVICGNRIGTKLKEAEEVVRKSRIGTKLKETEKTPNYIASSSQCSAGENFDFMQEENNTTIENIDKENCDIAVTNVRNFTNIDNDYTSHDSSDTSHVKIKKRRLGNIDIMKDTMNTILEEFRMRRKESVDSQKKFLELQEKIAINKIPAREERNNILKEKNLIFQEQNKLLKNQNSLLQALLSELKELNNST